MAFPDNIVEQAWQRADEKCECTRMSHVHAGRCNKMLLWGNRGREDSGAWEAHHIIPVDLGGQDILSNCEILCWNCHVKSL